MVDISKFDLIIFDFDGVIADSLGAYRELDRLVIKDLYNIDEPIEKIEELSQAIKTGALNNSEDDYYHAIDERYGDGKKPLAEIWEKIFKLAPVVQANIKLKAGVIGALSFIKKNASCPLALATSSSRSDINFFSTKESKIGQKIDLNHFFDTIITFDDVDRPKPDPESFLKIVKKYNFDPKRVFIF